jgi:hypothetical protein
MASQPTNDRIVALLEGLVREVRELRKLQDRMAADLRKAAVAKG